MNKLEGLARQAVTAEWLDLEVYAEESRRFRNTLADGESIGKAFKRFGEEEKVHLAALQNTFPETARSVKAPPALLKEEKLTAVLKRHIERELAAVRCYEDMIRCDLEPLDALLVKGILADETYHLKMLLHYLKAEF
ncbi:MAG: hypothetical protein WC943_03640 [Elusimicrobiota bacterium]|jgi:rubrerythrin